MRSYYRVMLGKGSKYANDCFDGGFIGADFDIDEDLGGKLPESWREFNAQYVPMYLSKYPGKSKIAAGLSCGFLWTVAKGIKQNDVVLCPDGTGAYRLGEVTGEYYYAHGDILPHRRPVRWSTIIINRTDMSEVLRKTISSIGTVSNISRAGHDKEMERLLENIPSDDSPGIENILEFALESHLEDFLIKNWTKTELGKNFDIYEENGGCVGKQYETDTGPLDILAISKDKKQLLVIELKKGRASDVVVGQTMRYMGYIKDEIADKGQTVKGIIIALEDDQRIRRALAVTPDIKFYRYKINFKLEKG